MKFNASFALIVICGLVACSQALPAKRLAYYQQPAAATRYYAAPQRMMFMRYVQPSFGQARSHEAAAALVAGESGATGTYLKGADGSVAAAAGEVQDDSFAAAADSHVAQSVAEAYPAAAASSVEEPVITVQVDLDPAISSAEASDNEAKEGRHYNYNVPAGGDATVEIETPEAAAADGATVTVGFPDESEIPAAVVPIAPAKRYLPAKKKVIVELEETPTDDAVAALNDEDNAVVDDLVPVVPKVPVARRPVVKKPVAANQKPQPVGTFFPVDFGGATGGAIALANSFSTGEGGSATSHAIAYGNPDQARAHLRPVRRH